MAHSTPRAEGTAARATLTIIAIMALVAALFTLTAPVFASHVAPQPTEGNQTCGSLMGEGFTELKVENPSGDGEVSDDNITIAFTIEDGVLSFEVTEGGDAFVVYGVFVKGGNIGGNFYDYRPNGTLADDGLTTPNNPNGTPAGISHISFCYAEAQVASSAAASTAAASSAAASTAAASSAAAQSVAGGTGTPAGGGTAPNTAMSDSRPGQLIVALGSMVLLVASLGALALPGYVRRHR